MPLTIGGKTYSDEEVKAWKSGGGNERQFLEQNGVTDPWQQRELTLQARGIYGAPTMEDNFKVYQAASPTGKWAGDYAGWENDLKNGSPGAWSAMQAGTFTGAANAPTDWAPGGVHADKTFGYAQSGKGKLGIGDGWGAPATGSTGASGTGTGGTGATSGTGGSGSSSSASGAPQMSLSSLQSGTNMTVDPRTQTVAGQLQSVLASDGPLIQQARTRALQTQNANGRLNSTMAQSAADSAMYDAALQIAAPDANTYNLAAQTNAATANTFSRDANAFTRQGEMANFNINANNWAAQQEAARQAARDKLLNEQGVTNSSTASTEAKKAAALTAYNNARAEFASKVAAISSNTEMDATARTDAINAMKINYNAIIKSAVTTLGWDNPDSWLIQGDVTSPVTAVAPTNVVSKITTPTEKSMDGA